jgi:iron complex transport system substrate-binding protein
MLAAAAVAAWTAMATVPAAADAPRRVVSFNLCADQLVLALADADQIAGLSPYAADPNLSVMADKARAFPRLDWQAEATIALQPDLVLIGPNDRSVTRRMLAAQGMRVAEVGFVADPRRGRTYRSPGTRREACR